MRKIIFLALAVSLLAPAVEASAVTNKIVSFQAEVWADNWFSIYANGKKVGQDSVPITTERSFNSEILKFSATYPLTIGIIAKDFTENSTGLEYIGKANQQIGDGGIVLQIREVSSKKIIALSDASWKSLVIDKAPINPECEKSSKPNSDCQYLSVTVPSGWSSASFKDVSWKNAIEYSKEAVGVKEGYFDISWSTQAKLIWSSDLKLDNTVLFRKSIKSSPINPSNTTKSFTLASASVDASGNLSKDTTCDGLGTPPIFTWSNAPTQTSTFVLIMDTIPGPLRPGEIDIGNHFYLTAFNIPATLNSFNVDANRTGTLGQNFQGKKLGYTPPCSQGGGSKVYTTTIYALASELSILPSDATEKNLLKAMEGKILSKAALSATYARP